jgi:catechol 2,3-dioxygenase-like lactoylglutathione lyase family enzyme
MLYLGVDHPAISCHDVNGQVDWYCRNLGLKVIFNDGKTPASVLVGYEGEMTAIELMPVRHPGPEPAEAQRYQPGLRHLALRVGNFDEAYNGLRSLGIKFITEPMPAVGGGKTAFFRDPEGNELQIIERNGKTK